MLMFWNIILVLYWIIVTFPPGPGPVSSKSNNLVMACFLTLSSFNQLYVNGQNWPPLNWLNSCLFAMFDGKYFVPATKWVGQNLHKLLRAIHGSWSALLTPCVDLSEICCNIIKRLETQLISWNLKNVTYPSKPRGGAVSSHPLCGGISYICLI